MEKLIIENKTKKSMIELLEYVKLVLKQGRISETSKGKQYSFVTTFRINGEDDEVAIYADLNKNSDKLLAMTMKKK